MAQGFVHPAPLGSALVIRLERVTKMYKTSTRPALDGVSVVVERGEFVHPGAPLYRIAVLDTLTV